MNRYGTTTAVLIATAIVISLIGERLAKTLWPNESAVGKQLRTIGPTPAPLTVVGVVADVLHGGLETGSPSPDGTFLSISTGFTHACDIRTDRTIACWGDDASGQSTVPAL